MVVGFHAWKSYMSWTEGVRSEDQRVLQGWMLKFHIYGVRQQYRNDVYSDDWIEMEMEGYIRSAAIVDIN